MKVAIISRSDQSVGGASRAAAILADLLRRHGHYVDHWVGHVNTSTMDRHELIFPPNVRKLTRYSRAASGLLGLFDVFTPDIVYFARKLRKNKYDVVHLHDIVMTISPWTINQISKDTPVIQTLHDVSPFTGGCIYSGDCDKYLRRCGKCPELRKGTWPMRNALFDGTGLQQAIKRSCYRDIATVAPCQWMRNMALRSKAFVRETQLIRYGVDEERFRPVDRDHVRHALGLPEDRKIIVFIATSVDDKRKGFAYAVEALKRYSGPKPLLLAIGHPPPIGAYDLSGVDYRILGFIQDLRLVTLYLSVADALLFPTLQDNSPFVLLETMAVGTPAVTFDTGGVAETVIHEECGYVAPQKDLAGLIRGLEIVLQDPERAAYWRKAARRRIEQYHSFSTHLAEHLKLYTELVQGRFSSLAGAR